MITAERGVAFDARSLPMSNQEALVCGFIEDLAHRGEHQPAEILNMRSQLSEARLQT